MRRGRAGAVAVLLLATAAATSAGAQTTGVSINLPVDQEHYPRVAVTVTAPEELAGQSLPEDAFGITEDGQARDLSLGNSPGTSVSNASSVVLVIDVSGSMRYAIDRAKQAAITLATGLPTGSEVAIVTFGESSEIVLPFTTDTGAVQQALESVEVDPDAQTALHDGVIEAAAVLDTAKKELASIVLLSDGGDTASAADEGDALEQLEQSDATVYAVALQTDEDNFALLDRLVGERGEVAEAANSDELGGIYNAFATELSSQYILKYQSEATGEVELGVEVAWDTVHAETTETITLTGQPAAGPSAPMIAAPEPFTVRPTLLSSRPALVTGTVALALGSFGLLLVLLEPRRTSTRERLRLLPEQSSGDRRLLRVVEWATAIADRGLRRADLGQRLDRALEQAGLELRPGELVVIGASAMVVAFAFGVLAANPLFGILSAAIVPLVIRLVLVIRRDRRQAAFAEQLTDLLQLLSGSLRAGYGLLQGIDAAARDADEPAASEFRRILIEHRLGRDLNEAMGNCAERMKNDDFAWVVQAIGIHRDVGGDLARVLDNIITTVRSRGEVHRQVRALSAEGRMSATVLTALPFVVLVALQFMSPDYLRELYTNPLGLTLLALSGVLMLVGILWIRRLVRIRY